MSGQHSIRHMGKGAASWTEQRARDAKEVWTTWGPPAMKVAASHARPSETRWQVHALLRIALTWAGVTAVVSGLVFMWWGGGAWLPGIAIVVVPLIFALDQFRRLTAARKGGVHRAKA